MGMTTLITIDEGFVPRTVSFTCHSQEEWDKLVKHMLGMKHTSELAENFSSLVSTFEDR